MHPFGPFATIFQMRKKVCYTFYEKNIFYLLDLLAILFYYLGIKHIENVYNIILKK